MPDQPDFPQGVLNTCTPLLLLAFTSRAGLPVAETELRTQNNSPLTNLRIFAGVDLPGESLLESRIHPVREREVQYVGGPVLVGFHGS